MRFTLVLIFTFFTMAGAAELFPAEWPAFRGNAQNQGGVGAGPGADKLRQKWRFQTGGPVDSSPAVVGDVVYIGSDDGRLYALDALSGYRIWDYQAQGAIVAQPVVKNGTVYFATIEGYLYALSQETGKPTWAAPFRTVGRIKASPLASGEAIYIGSLDRRFYAVDAQDGTELWQVEAADKIRASATVYKNTILFGCNDASVYQVLASSGKLVHKFQPTAANHAALIAIREARLEQEKKRKLLAMGMVYVPVPVDERQKKSELFKLTQRFETYSDFYFVNSKPAIKGQLMIFTSSDQHAYAFDLESKEFVWGFHCQDMIIGSPAIFGNRVVIASMDNKVYGVDLASGDQVWEYLTGGDISASPVLLFGTVFVGSADHNIYVLDAAKGTLRQKYGVLGPVRSSPVAVDGLLFFGSADGGVYALAEESFGRVAGQK